MSKCPKSILLNMENRIKQLEHMCLNVTTINAALTETLIVNKIISKEDIKEHTKNILNESLLHSMDVDEYLPN